MKHLILLRGAPGVGKSTFLKENDLERYTVCPDIIRLMFQTPVWDLKGKECISQRNDRQVWQFVYQLLEERMKRGETTIIDATHSRSTLINRYRNLCKKYRYRCTIVEFKKDLETILSQNANRDNFKSIPEDAIKRIHERMKTDKIPGWVNVIKPKEFDKFSNILFDFTNLYKEVVVFGDIHGCFEPLKNYFNNNPFNLDTFYIFTGDYFDRGMQNVEVFDFLYQLLEYRNILFLPGNHEVHLFNYIHEEEIRSPQARITLAEFEKAGIDKKQIKEFTDRIGQLGYFKFHENTYVITHGGIPNIPTIFTATQDLIKGIGKYEESDIVDEAFGENVDSGNGPDVFSIHAHRNVYNVPIHNTKFTFNLCNEVEMGGHLRVLKITPNNFEEIEILNSVYDETLIKRQKSFKRPKLELTNNEIINGLNRDKDIIKKDLENGVISYNFSKKVFRRRNWTERNMKARGLFIDNEKEKIVARSYDKFFNWNEVEDTKTLNLKDNLKFPVRAYRKHNGFLGILSVRDGKWFASSKSTVHGPFAEWFKQIIKPKLTDELKQFIIENDVSLIFEVIDPINDPHIIKYYLPDIVLLDVVKNKFNFEKYNYEELKTVGLKYAFEIKELDYTFESWKELHKFKNEQDELNPFQTNYEGWVFEDTAGFMLKYKTTYYKFWKSIRDLKERVYKKGDSNEIKNRLHSFEQFKVYNFLITLDKEDLKRNVIQLRTEFHNKESICSLLKKN